MIRSTASSVRVLLGFLLVAACSDRSSPTQPARSTAAPSAKPTADVAIGTAVTPETIYACYVVAKGTMYRIKTSDTAAECEKKDIQFSWTDHGSGPISGIIFASDAATLPSDGRYRAVCPAGKSVMNFGWEIPVNSTASSTQIKANRPAINGPQVVWGFVAAPNTSYVFYWTCADADPYTLAS